MEVYGTEGLVGRAALRAGMDRKTARKYLRLGKLPSELRTPRTWKTRPDPFADYWPRVVTLLAESEGQLEAKSILDVLIAEYPNRYQESHLRTLQRRVRRWKATQGPEKRVFFPQDHPPGKAMQTDFTHGTALGVTIGGEPFAHLICHTVLPYSNWESVTVCQSESMAAIKRGVQAAVFMLGRVPEFHQTDNSTAATHDLGKGLRGFNREYVALMEHLGMKPRTTEVGAKEQNGDVESANGAFKRRAGQALHLRGSRDFEAVATYEHWLQGVATKANAGRRKKLEEELPSMTALRAERLPEFTEETVRVRSWSTIAVKKNSYSVPSQLIGEEVKVRIFDDKLEVWYAQEMRLVIDRVVGQGHARINYRHIIDSLLKKPGAFEHYRYKEALFPSLTFRKAYDRLQEALAPLQANIHYLRILHLAAKTMESDVEQGLSILLEVGVMPTADEVKALVAPEKTPVPAVPAPVVHLEEYDALLAWREEVAV